MKPKMQKIKINSDATDYLLFTVYVVEENIKKRGLFKHLSIIIVYSV